MKKRFLLVSALFAFVGMSLSAQNCEKTYPENYWFIQGQVGAGYTVGEPSFGKLISPAAALSVGKSFNPIIAVRAQVSGWEGKGGWKNSTDVHPINEYSFNYVQGSFDALLNLTNIFCGYKESRVFNLIGFVGVGAAHSWGYDDNVGLASTEAVNSAVARAGILTNFRLSRSWDFNLELNGNGINDSFNAKGGSVNDWQFNLLAGFTYKFGHKAPQMVEDPCCAAQVNALNDQINAQRAEINELRGRKPEVQYVEREKIVTEKEAMAYVAFKIGKSTIGNEEMVHVYQIAQFMKDNSDAKVTVTGYADVKTGSAAINKRLSEQRANAVAKALTDKFGIASNRVTVDYKGDSAQPLPENDWNRIVIMISK